MPLHSVSPRQQAWYSSSTDGSFDYNTNPFAKKRKPSVYPEPDVDEGPKPPDSENFVAELVRRGTRELTFAKTEEADTKAPTQIEAALSPLQSVDEENPALPGNSLEDQPHEGLKPNFNTWKQRVFLFRRQLGSHLARLRLGRQWEVKHAIADIATSTIAFAPLSVSGQCFLPATPRPRQTVVIEYAVKSDDTRQGFRLLNFRTEVRVFFGQAEHPQDKGGRFKGLSALTEEVPRVYDYVQDDDAACEQLILDYHIHSPAFSRSRTNFRDWIHGEEADHLSVWQTALWRPSYERAGNVVRAAFGLQYLVPQLRSVSVLESHSRFSKKSRLKAVVDSSNEDVHDNSLQRLSVYIQLPRDRDYYMESPSEAYNLAIRSMTEQGKRKAAMTKLACERTVVILDSRLKAIATAPLIAGQEPWQQLLEDLPSECPDEQSDFNGRLALAVVGLAFEAVAARWVHYILCMHKYIASLEEDVYENPAADSRTSALWSVSKQLLQAERLLKFHILLLENIQNDFRSLLQTDSLSADWLRPNLDEFRRLSSEVEETLQKPTAHMVDLYSRRTPVVAAQHKLVAD
ncbi:MAG: hypothetical protein Q9221_001777 [Calogaya cf. arnoldii]